MQRRIRPSARLGQILAGADGQGSGPEATNQRPACALNLTPTAPASHHSFQLWESQRSLCEEHHELSGSCLEIASAATKKHEHPTEFDWTSSDHLSEHGLHTLFLGHSRNRQPCGQSDRYSYSFRLGRSQNGFDPF